MQCLLQTADIFRPTREFNMKDAHNTAAEHHKSAAKSHRAAAAAHGSNDHAKGKEHSTQAQQHAQTANEHSKTAQAKSAHRNNASLGSRRSRRLPSGLFSITSDLVSPAGDSARLVVIVFSHVSF